MQGAAPRVTALLALPWGPGALRHVPQVPDPTSEPPLQGMWEPLARGRAPPGSVTAQVDFNQGSSGPLADPPPMLDSALAAAIASLSDLRALHIAGIELQGVLPGLWGSSLPHLSYLNLSHNALAGTLPPSFGRLSALAVLYECPYSFTHTCTTALITYFA